MRLLPAYDCGRGGLDYEHQATQAKTVLMFQAVERTPTGSSVANSAGRAYQFPSRPPSAHTIRFNRMFARSSFSSRLTSWAFLPPCWSGSACPRLTTGPLAQLADHLLR